MSTNTRRHRRQEVEPPPIDIQPTDEAAIEAGRRFDGIEKSPEFVRLTTQRLTGEKRLEEP